MTTTTQGQAPADTNTASGAADLTDTVCKALRRAWQLGQTYWQQADSESFVQNKKSETTHAAFVALLDDTRAALASAPVQPVAEPANGALPEREAIIRAAVAAMPHTNPLVADDLLTGHTMHTEAEDVIAIWKAGAASRWQAPAGVTGIQWQCGPQATGYGAQPDAGVLEDAALSQAARDVLAERQRQN